MREIKFRGWNGSRWMYGYLVHNGKFWFIQEGIISQGIEEKSIGQFTGLKDREGKEIWEGDILAHTSWVQNKANGSPQDDFSDHKIIEGVPLNLNKNPFPIHRDFVHNPYRVVEYIAHEEFYQATGFFSPFVGGCRPKEFEVLGNIYEHLELLKEKP